MNENRIRTIFPDPDISFPESYRSLRIPPVWNRPEGEEGMFIYNRSNRSVEAFIDGDWRRMAVVTEASPEASESTPEPVLEAGSNVELEYADGRTVIHVREVGDFTVGDNIGQGTGSLYQGKETTVLKFRRLVSDSELLKIETAQDTIRFSIPDLGETNIGRGLGQGISVYAGKNDKELLFRNLASDGSLSMGVLSSGDIQIGLNPSMDLRPGKLLLPIHSNTDFSVGEIRFNKDALRYEVGSPDGWQILSTDAGTFLPITGGDIGALNLTQGATTVKDIVLDGGRLVAGPNGMEINLENGGQIVTGFQGTIDGYRIPAIGATHDALNALNPGLIRKVPGGFSSFSITGSDQIEFADGHINLVENVRLPGAASVVLPSGPDSSRDMRTGGIRYNSASDRIEAMLLNGWEQVATTNTGKFSTLRVNGEMYITGMINGRDIQTDAILLDTLNGIRGLVYRGADGLGTTRIMSDSDRPGIHVNDGGAEIKIGLDPSYATNLSQMILDGLDQDIVRSNTTIHGRLIDGRNLVQDGMVVDNLTSLPTGIVTSSGGGLFSSRLLLPSADPTAVGLSVDRSDGSSDIRLGLRLSELPEIETLDPNDWVIVTTSTGNAKIKFSKLLAAMLAS